MESYKMLSFGRLSYVMGGVNIVVKSRVGGELREVLFRGTIEELHADQNKALHNRLDTMEVISLDVDGNALLIGVDDE